MSFDKNISVSVGTDALPVQTTAFNIPLHATSDVTFSENVRSYRSAAEGTADDELGTEAKAAVDAHFSQTLHAPELLIGKLGTTPVAQVITESIGGTPVEGDVVTITVNGITASYTALATPTVDSVASGIRAALTTALTDEDVTVSGATSDIIVTADNAGESFTYSETYTQTGASTGTITAVVTTANAGIADDLAAIAAENNTWFGLTLEVDSVAATLKVNIKECAKYAEANDKLFVPQSSEAGVLDKTADNIADWLQDRSYQNTAYTWHHDDSEQLGTSVMAFKFEADPDLKTTFWAYAPVVGITLKDPALTSTEQNNLEDQNANFVCDFGGNVVYGMGTVANGRKIDTVITLLWYAARLEEAYIQTLSDVSARNSKVGYNDKETQTFVNAGADVNALGERVRHFNEDSTSVVVTPIADTPAGQQATRTVLVEASGEATGAAERVTVTAYVAVA